MLKSINKSYYVVYFGVYIVITDWQTIHVFLQFVDIHAIKNV